MDIRKLLEIPDLREELTALSNVRSFWSDLDLDLPEGTVSRTLEKTLFEQQARVEKMIREELGKMPSKTLHEVIDTLLVEIKS